MRVWILFVLCWLYFLDHVICLFYFFNGDCKSCGLPPECNIHCYVLDVSMPKHTMHCTPDLVTVLPWWFIYGLFMWSCCWLVYLKPPSAVFPSWHVKRVYTCLTICLWLVGVHGLLEDNLSEPNSSEKLKKSCKLMFQNTVAILSHFSVCCYDVLLSHFHEYERCDFF